MSIFSGAEAQHNELWPNIKSPALYVRNGWRNLLIRSQEYIVAIHIQSVVCWHGCFYKFHYICTAAGRPVMEPTVLLFSSERVTLRVARTSSSASHTVGLSHYIKMPYSTFTSPHQLRKSMCRKARMEKIPAGWWNWSSPKRPERLRTTSPAINHQYVPEGRIYTATQRETHTWWPPSSQRYWNESFKLLRGPGTVTPVKQLISLPYPNAKVLIIINELIFLQGLQRFLSNGGLNIPLPCRMIQGFHSSHERTHWSQGVVSHPNLSGFTAVWETEG